MKRSRTFALLAVGLAFTAAALPAQAGPPLLCHPYQISSAKSLPWGKDSFNNQDKSYDRSKVVNDTLTLLKTERSALVRMETLRRAAIYIGDDRAKGTELLAKISWIAMDGEAADQPTGEAWFNAGYLAATFRQSGNDIGWRPGVADGIDGYAWVQRALELQPDDPAMQFGAAMVAHGHSQFKDHLRRAVAGAEPDSDLARSIESNYAAGRKSLKDLRAELGVDDKASAAASKTGKSGG